jgi:hypothetical protein
LGEETGELNGATGTVRYNTVIGHINAFGGWNMGESVFHDNYSLHSSRGFNIDSDNNGGVEIRNNTIIHPWGNGGITVGSHQPGKEWYTFQQFQIHDNVIRIDRPMQNGITLNGHATQTAVYNNIFIADPGNLSGSSAIHDTIGDFNDSENIFQSNMAFSTLPIVNVKGKSRCQWRNLDENGVIRTDLPNLPATATSPCLVPPQKVGHD